MQSSAGCALASTTGSTRYSLSRSPCRQNCPDVWQFCAVASRAPPGDRQLVASSVTALQVCPACSTREAAESYPRRRRGDNRSCVGAVTDELRHDLDPAELAPLYWSGLMTGARRRGSAIHDSLMTRSVTLTNTPAAVRLVPLDGYSGDVRQGVYSWPVTTPLPRRAADYYCQRRRCEPLAIESSTGTPGGIGLDAELAATFERAPIGAVRHGPAGRVLAAY